MKPSRTYSIAKLGIVVLAFFGALLAIIAIRCDHDTLTAFAGSIADLGFAVAGLAGAGAGSLATRDSFTRGLTSSAGDMIASLQAGNAPAAATPAAAPSTPDPT